MRVKALSNFQNKQKVLIGACLLGAALISGSCAQTPIPSTTAHSRDEALKNSTFDWSVDSPSITSSLTQPFPETFQLPVGKTLHWKNRTQIDFQSMSGQKDQKLQEVKNKYVTAGLVEKTQKTDEGNRYDVTYQQFVHGTVVDQSESVESQKEIDYSEYVNDHVF